MNKDFENWNKLKKDLDMKAYKAFIYERQIWWCSIGINIGDEEDGKNLLFERPVLVIKKFNHNICLILPMSTKIKSSMYYHELEDSRTPESVLLSQIRIFSTKRFRRFVRRISTYEFALVKGRLKDILN